MIRLVIACLLLALSLLTSYKAPTNLLWKVSVAINEFPLIPITITLLSLWFGWKGNFKLITTAGNLIALVLFCLPIVYASIRSNSLESDLEKAFGKIATPIDYSPFSISQLVSGNSLGEVAFQRVTYGKSSKGDLTCDYYPAQIEGLRPCIIVIHGGSWQEGQGDSEQLPALNSFLARKGWNVVSMNYRLAPSYQYPAPVEDVKSVIACINEHATEWNIDTNQLILLGRSAGGQIALQAAYSVINPHILGVISYYAPADMAWGARVKTNKWVLDVDKVLTEYIGGTVEEVPEKYDLASAPPLVNNNSIPTLLIHGPIDAMVSYEHSVHLQAKLNEFGVKNYLLDLPTSTHGCDYTLSGQSGQTSTYAVEYFIRSLTK